jgi:hypothetical protein
MLKLPPLRLAENKISSPFGAGFRQHDVAGLEITMRHPIAVRLVQGTGNLDPALQHIRHRNRPVF